MAKRRPGQDVYKTFGDVFRSTYRADKTSALSKRDAQIIQELQAGSAATLGHPEYLNLPVGETRTSNAVISFIDIRGFTKLSFALECDDLLRIVQALTEASIAVIKEGGGYVGEFTGDGVMAYFGDSTVTDTESVYSALETTSLLFKTVEEIVNPELKDQGIDPIRIAAGMEFGSVLWSRIGTSAASQVKPIATATFLAGKLCSGSYTKAWECKIGAQLAKWVPDELKTKVSQYGPFSLNGKQFSRELYLLDWRELGKQSLLNEQQLEERIRRQGSLFASSNLATTSLVVDTDKSNQGAPRPLKDQPFFGGK